MKTRVLLALTAVATLFAACQNGKVSTDVSLKTKADTVSYMIGSNIGESLKMGAEHLNEDVLYGALAAQLRNEDVIEFTEEEMRTVLQEFGQKIQEAQQQEMENKANENKAKGEAFLAENAKKDGVKTTESGLQYEIITKGEGEIPTVDSSVECHYEGTLIDGKVFDSSYKRGEPATFPVGGVIRGWTEALQIMPVGSKWKLYIPSELAYGARGAGADIGPNETLIFTIELIGIDDAKQAN